MKSYTYLRLFYRSLAICLLFTFSACKKEKEVVSNEATGSKFIFSVASLNGSPNSKLATTKAPLNMNSNSNSVTTLANNRNIIYGNKEESISRVEQPNNAINKISKKIASTSVVYPYMRYRILLYNVTTGLLEKNIETDASRPLEIPVISGDEYKWYAYSYNTAGNVDQPVMENNIPTIRTFSDKEFIWASSGSSPIQASNAPIPLDINFEHKVAEVIIEIDTKDLHGTITDLEVEFDQPNYLNTAKINLQTGIGSEVMDYGAPILDENSFLSIPGDTTKLQTRIYTADPANLASGQQSSGLNLKINKLTAEHHGGQTREFLKTSDPPKLLSFNFTSPSIAKSHVASMAFRYTIPTKRILHVIGYQLNNDDDQWGFAAQPRVRVLDNWTYVESANFSPLNMIKAPLNFGNEPNSIVQSRGFTHARSTHIDKLATKIAIPGEIPDIVIISVYYQLTAADITALTAYLNNGGVVIMMTDSAIPLNAQTYPNEVDPVESFFQTIFNNTAITLDYGNTTNRYFGPMLFELDHERTINDRIINGPFGNLSGKYWGNDSYAVVQAKNLPIGTGPNEVTVYSNPQAENSALPPLGVSMFKHNSKNLFWIGDGSFLSHPSRSSSGWSTGWSAEPFATVGTNQNNPHSGPNHFHYPVPKRYGVDYNHPILGNIGFSYGAEVYNAPLFANLMAWALYQSEFFGKNNKIPTTKTDWNITEGSYNFNYNQ